MHSPSGRAPSLIVLGTDAVLAARPATPVQLAHACLALGYDGVVPGSWGDELVADAAMRRLATHEGPAVLCACPVVAERLLHGGAELQPFLVAVASPPVAVARYLRAMWEPTRIHLTFAGGCAGASDEAIDTQLAPAALLAAIAERGIVLAEQPQVFDEVIPPDRRRFHSMPGGVPAPDRLRERCGRTLVELRGDDVAMELAQLLLTENDVLVDLGASIGCACSGAAACGSRREAREVLAALEPPRAKAPVLVEPRTPLSLELALDAPPEPAAPHLPEPPAPPADVPAAAAAPAPVVPTPAPERGGRSDRATPRSFAARRRPGERPRHPSFYTFDRRRVGFVPLLTGDGIAPMDGPAADAATAEPEAPESADAQNAPTLWDLPAAPETPDAPETLDAPDATAPEEATDPTDSMAASGDAEPAEMRDPEPPAAIEPAAEPAVEVEHVVEPATELAALARREERPQPRADELERLRRTAERALAPFIARVQAMSELAAPPEEPRAPAPARPAPAVEEPPRPSDVATPIVVTREPGVVPWDKVLEPPSQDELPEPEAPRVPTLKSVAAASRASAQTAQPRASASAPRRSHEIIVLPPRRRWGLIATGAAVLAAAATVVAVMLMR